MNEIKIEDFNIEGLEAQKEFFKLSLFNLVDGTDICLPVAVAGKGKGKTVTIVAAQHGNEWMGSYACHLLYQALDPNKMSGKVVMIPIANPQAFIQKARVSSLDHIDMNRTYGFVKKRKPTEHLASIIFEEFCLKSNYVLDLHSGGPGEYQPLVEFIDDKRLEVAKSFNLDHLMVRKKDQGSLVPNCENYGIGAFSIEAGKALNLDRKHAENLKDGIINFLKKLKILEGKPKTNKNQKVYKRKIIFPAEKSGFFESNVKLLDRVEKGQQIANIWPFFQEKRKKIISPVKGTVVYLRAEEVISQGDSIVHIGS